MNKQNYEDSAYLEAQIQMKEQALDALLNSPKPDVEKLRAVNEDIRELRSLAEQEQRNYNLEMNKTTQGYRSNGR